MEGKVLVHQGSKLCLMMLSELKKTCEILQLEELFFNSTTALPLFSGEVGDGIEKPAARSLFHLKGFTMLAQENISTSSLVAPEQVLCSYIVLYHIIILCIISPS